MSKAHAWIPEGTGELSSRWLRPVCGTNLRRHITNMIGAEAAPDDRCADCVEAIEGVKARVLA